MPFFLLKLLLSRGQSQGGEIHEQDVARRLNFSSGVLANRKLSLVLSPKVNMKPDTNLSRRSSVILCNRHQIDFQS